MKKILLISILFSWIFFFISFKPVSAVCRPQYPGSCTKVKCKIDGNWNCCDSSSECAQQSGTPEGNNPNFWCPGFENEKLNTAIGCIPILGNKEILLGWILGWAIGLGGGIAFLLIVYAGFLIMTSQGNPERLQAGKELLTSALSGLILLIFSIFILKVIGVDILGLGRFGFGQ